MIGRWSTFNNVMLPITISIFIQHTIFIIVDLVSCFSKVYVTWSVMHITGWAWPLVTPTKTTVLKKNTVIFTCIPYYICMGTIENHVWGIRQNVYLKNFRNLIGISEFNNLEISFLSIWYKYMLIYLCYVWTRLFCSGYYFMFLWL